MLLQHVQLGTQPQRLTKDTILLRNDKCIIKTAEGTLTLPILVDDNPSGHLFIGKGEFTLDAIIETTRGAIGKPMTRNLTPNQPFLMFNATKNLNENLTPASTQDLSNMAYRSTDEFLKKADDTLDQFVRRRHGHFDIESDTHIFAFATEHGRWDILVAKQNKLVYASKHRVYVSRDNGESVSVGPAQILVAKKGKTVVIDKGNILVDRDAP